MYPRPAIRIPFATASTSRTSAGRRSTRGAGVSVMVRAISFDSKQFGFPPHRYVLWAGSRFAGCSSCSALSWSCHSVICPGHPPPVPLDTRARIRSANPTRLTVPAPSRPCTHPATRRMREQVATEKRLVEPKKAPSVRRQHVQPGHAHPFCCNA